MPTLTTPWLQTLLVATVAALAALAALLVVHPVLVRVSRGAPVLAAVIRRCHPAARFALPLAALQVVWHGAPEQLPALGPVQHANGVLLLAVLTWLAMSAVRGVAEGVIAMHPLDVADNLQARRIGTQTTVLARTVMVMLLLAGVSMILMTFPGARQIGTSLLASAGVAGVVVGLAARPLVSNLFAGLQIALAQPIRLDDVLIVQGEWGRVEQITGTYVVLRLWDERRLVIPLQWFIENPFQNWTRTTSRLIGTVFLHVDYAMPLAPLRAEAERLCAESKDWDGRLCVLQVTEAGARDLELRLLVTASDSSRAWDLRCFVREGLVAFLQREYPQHLPTLRVRDGRPERPERPQRPERPGRDGPPTGPAPAFADEPPRP